MLPPPYITAFFHSSSTTSSEILKLRPPAGAERHRRGEAPGAERAAHGKSPPERPEHPGAEGVPRADLALYLFLFYAFGGTNSGALPLKAPAAPSGQCTAAHSRTPASSSAAHISRATQGRGIRGRLSARPRSRLLSAGRAAAAPAGRRGQTGRSARSRRRPRSLCPAPGRGRGCGREPCRIPGRARRSRRAAVCSRCAARRSVRGRDRPGRRRRWRRGRENVLSPPSRTVKTSVYEVGAPGRSARRTRPARRRRGGFLRYRPAASSPPGRPRRPAAPRPRAGRRPARC